MSFCRHGLAVWSHILVNHSKPNKSDFFLKTVFGVTESDPLPWFSQVWSTGKFVSMLWAVFALFINSAYTCNLRSHIMKPITEKPIDRAQDVFDRGQKLWTEYYPLSDEDSTIKDCFLMSLIIPEMRDYIRESNSSFPLRLETPGYVLEDIQQNGGSIVDLTQPRFPYDSAKYKGWRKAKENPMASFQMQVLYTARKQVWKTSFDYWIIRLRETGITMKLYRIETDYIEYVAYPNQQQELFLLDLEKVSTMFFILTIGLFLSLIAFLVEILRAKIHLNI